jgi:hypothetical protein
VEITNIKEIQGIIRDYFENLYSDKLENLEKNGQISRYIRPSKTEPRGYESPKQIYNMNEIETAINSLYPKEKSRT